MPETNVIDVNLRKIAENVAQRTREARTAQERKAVQEPLLMIAV